MTSQNHINSCQHNLLLMSEGVFTLTKQYCQINVLKNNMLIV